jgi:exodeoxyribonuclease-1
MSTAFIAIHRQYPGTLDEQKAKAVYANMPETYRQWVKEETLVRYLTSTLRQSILWHDYEAGGTDAKAVQPLQFAAIRTDLLHQYLDEPMDIYCRLPGDKLPHPVAIAITRINPLHCEMYGVPEPVFFRLIQSEMNVPATCVAGQNSMKYDEEVTRFGFWRNLLPVYDREFKNNNSRWDLLPVLAAYSALNVPGIVWPLREDDPSLRSLKLEYIAKSNGITQDSAHNALDDVKALIDVSALLQSSDQSLWDHFFSHRFKKRVAAQTNHLGMGLLISASNGAKNNFMAPLLLIGKVPGEDNKWVGVDLSQRDALRSCYHLDVAEIKRRLYMKTEELDAEQCARPPIKTFAINKSPVFMPSEWVKKHEPALWKEEWQLLANNLSPQTDFLNKLRNVYVSEQYPPQDAELSLYEGFASPADAAKIQQFSWMNTTEVFSSPMTWDNPFYHTMWQRARWKLAHAGVIAWGEGEYALWCAHRHQRLMSNIPEGGKHEHVNLENVDAVLSETEMPDDLRSGYRDWLDALRKELSSINREI